MNFSEKLIRLRKREGISQEELASYLEVSRQAVSRWEQGTSQPNMEPVFMAFSCAGLTPSRSLL